MKISILSFSARGESDVAVTFELCEGEYTQRETFLLPISAVADMRLARGECSQDRYEEISRCAQVHQAVKRGLYLLGYGSCSPRALCGKLVAKGVLREIAEEAVDILSRDGYLNEFSDALREAERCVSKGWGERRIVETLRTKRFSQESIRCAMEQLEADGVDYVELCAELVCKRCDEIPAEPKDRQKLISSLMRYGFSAAEIREAFAIFREKKGSD